MTKSKKQVPVVFLVPGYKMKDPVVFAAFYKNLTGKDISPEGLKEAMTIMEGVDLQSNDDSTPQD